MLFSCITNAVNCYELYFLVLLNLTFKNTSPAFLCSFVSIHIISLDEFAYQKIVF